LIDVVDKEKKVGEELLGVVPLVDTLSPIKKILR
jgi:hypothetical protein